jgi:hypothetical protein
MMRIGAIEAGGTKFVCGELGNSAGLCGALALGIEVLRVFNSMI